MPDKILIPSIEARLHGLIEASRRNLLQQDLARAKRQRPSVTLSREFGCEGYPVAEMLRGMLEARSGSPWLVMDRALLDEAARDNQLTARILENLGSRNGFLDDMLSTFSPHWKSEKDYYRLLSNQIIALAHAGQTILVGRGAALLTQGLGNCFHFRVVAPMSFKVNCLAKRTGEPPEKAREMIRVRQRQRDTFLKEFLGRDVADPTLYHLLFNNARCPAGRIAALIAEVVYPQGGA